MSITPLGKDRGGSLLKEGQGPAPRREGLGMGSTILTLIMARCMLRALLRREELHSTLSIGLSKLRSVKAYRSVTPIKSSSNKFRTTLNAGHRPVGTVTRWPTLQALKVPRSQPTPSRWPSTVESSTNSETQLKALMIQETAPVRSTRCPNSQTRGV